MDTLKSVASEVGNKLTTAKNAIEKKLTEAVNMLPVIDLRNDDPIVFVQDYLAGASTQAPTWKCSSCSYLNPSWANLCTMCQHVNPANPPGISSIYPQSVPSKDMSNKEDKRSSNSDVSDRAKKSATSNGHIYPSLQDDTSLRICNGIVNEWACSQCTLYNKKESAICAVCGHPQVTDGQSRRSLERLPSVEQGWNCSGCTFLNPVSGNVCLMCSTPKKISSSEKNDTYETADVEELRRFHEQEAIQQWEGIVAFCRRDKHPFVDDRFLPLKTSLSAVKFPPEFAKVQSWLRPSQLRQSPLNTKGNDWTVCRTPMASDIRQGLLGDCWFLCSLSVVAERPELIHKVIMTKDYNKEGAYLIRLCIDGLWRVILVDDLFPVDGFGNLAFSQAGRRQLWVPLIEKALAKYHGSYYAIEGGFVNEGLMFLTGAPCDRIQLDAATNDEYDSIWASLLSFHSSRFLMGASCGKVNQSLNEEECRKLGLRPRHSYSVLDVTDTDGLRLIRLRDPWGKGNGWKGEWSDQSKNWTPHLAAKLKPYGGAEGLFWLSLIDFVKYFESVDVSKYRENWKEIRVQGTFPNCALHKQWSVWNLKISETTEVDLTLYQQGYRGASHEANAHHLDLTVMVFSLLPNGKLRKLVGASKRSASSFVGLNVMLDPGVYVVWCLAFNHWNDMILPEETFPKNVLALHSAKTVVMEKLSAPPYSLGDAVVQWALTYGSKTSDRDGVLTFSILSGGLVLMYENRHANHCVQLVCDCTQSRDVVSTRGVLYTVDLIPPMTRFVVCILSPSHGSSFYIHYSTKQRLSNIWSGLGDWGPPNVTHLPETDSDLLRDLHSPRPINA